MYASAFVLGFHGCDESVGEKILRGNGHLQLSHNNYDWLGHGIYFWENSPARALHWAKLIKENPKWFGKRIRITKPFVLGAIIDLGNCLDLTEAASLEIIRAGYDEMKIVFAAAEISLPKNKPSGSDDKDLVRRNLDCAVINYVHVVREARKLKKFDSVRGAFFEGKPLYNGAKIMAKTHIQICIQDPSSIRGYFRPLPNSAF